ncbi:MAG: YbaN family protein [Peptococcaceae bacterium]|nr:YbaN family protein [Peptococcaceae bacterium]MBO5115068.1 YbaN family protein [Peptococcaceae bacterium]MBO5139709.1 YbaN family protein [Peptococcaceae bacterium]MBO5366158.1 YbaN family protein [Peptococcaceae bacterium]MBP3624848.1 YbaN family protein [Peptococcaceae bacterium]
MGITKLINAGLGLFFVALGSIGVFFPVLPTTPFLLLAAFFLARSSSKLNAWFESTDLYKNYIADFLETRSMTMKTKRYILTMATVAMFISGVLVDVIYARIALVLIAVIMHVYFKTQIRTIPEPEVCKDCA